MSGGSYNYLYAAAYDLSELITKRHDLKRMAERAPKVGT